MFCDYDGIPEKWREDKEKPVIQPAKINSD